MAEPGFSEPCRKNKDCSSNVCEMMYENNKPIGRFCINSESKYTIKCNVNKDCKSGNCKEIFDKSGKFLVKKCVKAPKIDDDTAFNTLFGKERKNKYGTVNSNTIKLLSMDDGPITELIIKLIDLFFNLINIVVFNFNACSDAKEEARKECEGYAKKSGIIGDTAENYTYEGLIHKECVRRCDKDTKECSCNPMTEQYHQAILYGVWRSIFDTVFSMFGGQAGGWIFSPSSTLYERSSKDDLKNGTAPKCDVDLSYGIDLWYLRTFITILFPPFGVLMAKGINGFFQIILSCVLTCLFYFPGLIYSFAVINSSKLDLREIKGFEKINGIKNTNRQEYLEKLKKGMSKEDK